MLTDDTTKLLLTMSENMRMTKDILFLQRERMDLLEQRIKALEAQKENDQQQ